MLVIHTNGDTRRLEFPEDASDVRAALRKELGGPIKFVETTNASSSFAFAYGDNEDDVKNSRPINTFASALARALRFWKPADLQGPVILVGIAQNDEVYKTLQPRLIREVEDVCNRMLASGGAGPPPAGQETALSEQDIRRALPSELKLRKKKLAAAAAASA